MSSIGLGLVQAYAALPDHTVIAALRTPDSMPDVRTTEGSKVVTIKVDAGVAEDAEKVSLSDQEGTYWRLTGTGSTASRERAWDRSSRYR